MSWYVLNENDREIFARLAEDFLRSKGQSRVSRVPETGGPGNPYVYVAKAPGGGIAARSGTTLSYADCDVYELIGGELTAVPGLTQRVWNLSDSAVDADTWVLVERDKFGKWLVKDASSGTADGTSVLLIEVETDLKEGDASGATGWILDGSLNRSTAVNVYSSVDSATSGTAGDDAVLSGAFRGVAFGLGSGTHQSRTRGDVVLAIDVGFYLAVGGGRTFVTGYPLAAIDEGEFGQFEVTIANGNETGTWSVEAKAKFSGGTSDEYGLFWSSQELTWLATLLGPDTAVFRLTGDDLQEGGAAVSAVRLDASFAAAESVTIDPVMTDTSPGLYSPWRGVAFGPKATTASGTDTADRLGDYVRGVKIAGNWYAVGSGCTGLTGEVVHTYAATAAGHRADVRVFQGMDDDRYIEVQSHAFFQRLYVGDRVMLQWNNLGEDTADAPGAGLTVTPVPHWDAFRIGESTSGTDDETPGTDDDSDVGGGGNNNGSCCNDLPDGVTCSPKECCNDTIEQQVTDCEDLNPALTTYKAKVPDLSCLPDGSDTAGNTDGILTGTVEMTHEEGTCVWSGQQYVDDENVTWYWQLEPAEAGGSVLILWKDDEEYLRYERDKAFCWRCKNLFEIVCPPSDCHNVTANLCVEPVCDDCATAPKYRITSPGDGQGLTNSTVVWGVGSTATAEVSSVPDEGHPSGPSRSVLLYYGTVDTSTTDGVASIDATPITYDPSSCEAALDEVRFSIWARLRSDGSVSGKGSWIGVGVNQGSSKYVATIGKVSSFTEWQEFTGQHLLQDDFDEVTTTGIDNTSHPDFTTTGSMLTFTIVVWQEGTAAEAPGDTLLAYVETLWDDVTLILCHADCVSGPAAMTCPEAAALIACEDDVWIGGIPVGPVEVSIVLTNSGGTEFNILSWEFLSSCTGVTSDNTPLGPLAAGASWTLTLGIDFDVINEAPFLCSGWVRIRTSLGDCDVQYTLEIVESGSCTAGEACSSYFDDDFGDTITEASGYALSAHTISPTNGGSLSWNGSVIQFTATTSAASEDGTSGPEWETDGSGLVVQPTTVLGLDEGNIQILTGAPANCIAKLATQVSYGGNVGEVYFHGLAFGVVDGKEWYAFGISGGSTLVLLKCTSAGIQTLESVSVGANTTGTLGVWLRNGVAHVAYDATQLAGVNALNNSSDVSYPPTLWEVAGITGTKLGLILHNNSGYDQAGKYRGYNSTGPTELCITNVPGASPPWEN